MIFVAIGLLASFCLWVTWEILVWRSEGLRSVTPGAAAGALSFEERPDLAVAVPGTISGAAGTVDWLRVDENVLQAVEQRTHGTIDNGLDLQIDVSHVDLSQPISADTPPSDRRMEPRRQARRDTTRAVEEYDSTATTVIAAANATWAREVVPAIEEELAAVSKDLAGQLETALGRAAAALADAEGALQTRSAGVLGRAMGRVAVRRRPLAFVAARRRRIWISQASDALAQDDPSATLDVLCARVHNDDALASIAQWSRARAQALAQLIEAGLRIELEVNSTRTTAFLCLNVDRQRLYTDACEEMVDAALRIWESGERVRHELSAAGARLHAVA